MLRNILGENNNVIDVHRDVFCTVQQSLQVALEQLRRRLDPKWHTLIYIDFIVGAHNCHKTLRLSVNGQIKECLLKVNVREKTTLNPGCDMKNIWHLVHVVSYGLIQGSEISAYPDTARLFFTAQWAT